MKVVLTENVPKLGGKWEVKDVPSGYARNFLFPRKLASPVTPELEERASIEHKKREEAAEKKLASVEALITKLDGIELHIFAKTDDSGTLFGSVGHKEIAEALKKGGIDIDASSFKVQKTLKEKGEHTAVLEFADGLEAEIKVIIDSEE